MQFCRTNFSKDGSKRELSIGYNRLAGSVFLQVGPTSVRGRFSQAFEVALEGQGKAPWGRGCKWKVSVLPNGELRMTKMFTLKELSQFGQKQLCVRENRHVSFANWLTVQPVMTYRKRPCPSLLSIVAYVDLIRRNKPCKTKAISC